MIMVLALCMLISQMSSLKIIDKYDEVLLTVMPRLKKKCISYLVDGRKVEG